MSKSQEIEEEYSNIKSSLDYLQGEMDKLFENTEGKITIENRPLKECIAEQGSLHVEWGLLFSSIRDNERQAENMVEKVYAMVYSREMSNSYKSLSSTDARMKATSDDDYVRAKRLHNEAIRLKDDCETVLNIIKSRQYSLKDLSNILISGVEDHVL